jgi:hypothetical protein
MRSPVAGFSMLTPDAAITPAEVVERVTKRIGVPEWASRPPMTRPTEPAPTIVNISDVAPEWRLW